MEINNTAIFSRAALILLFFVATFSGCKDFSDSDCTSNAGASTLLHNGESRQFIVHLPSSYNDSSIYPVLMSFHGYGGTATEFMNETDLMSLANEENFILVYPQGQCLSGGSHWNAGLDTPDNKSSTDDFGFIESLLIELDSMYAIDNERIYACGYSNGSFFSYALACYHSDKIAAIGSVSGTMFEETTTNCTPTHPTPIIHLHGTCDNVVPQDGGDGLASVPTVLEYWIGYNNTDSSPQLSRVNDNGTLIEHRLYSEGDSSVAVSYYSVVRGDHVWFDLNFQGANTGKLIWDFVSQYDINGRR